MSRQPDTGRDLTWELDRQAALRVLCAYCQRGPGQPCRNPRHGDELRSQAAHAVRIRAGHEHGRATTAETSQGKLGLEA